MHDDQAAILRFRRLKGDLTLRSITNLTCAIVALGVLFGPSRADANLITSVPLGTVFVFPSANLTTSGLETGGSRRDLEFNHLELGLRLYIRLWF